MCDLSQTEPTSALASERDQEPRRAETETIQASNVATLPCPQRLNKLIFPRYWAVGRPLTMAASTGRATKNNKEMGRPFGLSISVQGDPQQAFSGGADNCTTPATVPWWQRGKRVRAGQRDAVRAATTAVAVALEGACQKLEGLGGQGGHRGKATSVLVVSVPQILRGRHCMQMRFAFRSSCACNSRYAVNSFRRRRAGACSAAPFVPRCVQRRLGRAWPRPQEAARL